MSKNNEVIEINPNEEDKKSIKTWFKENGKKIAIVTVKVIVGAAAFIGGAVVMAALIGSKNEDSSEEPSDDAIDVDYTEVSDDVPADDSSEE